MFRRHEEISSEALSALRTGLAAAPVPEASEGFDQRVHAALAKPEAGWLELAWLTIRPALAPAACAMLVTLLLLQGVSTMTESARTGRDSGAVVAFGNPTASQDFLSAINP